MDDLSDLPPLEPYNKKRLSKQQPNLTKAIPSPEKKLQTVKPFPEMNSIVNIATEKSSGHSPQNFSKQFQNNISSVIRENPQNRKEIRKNRIQRASKAEKEQRIVEELDDNELMRGRRMINNMINKTGTKNMITEAQTSIETINKNIQELCKQIEAVEEKIYEIDYQIANDPNNGELEERKKELIHFVEKLQTTNRLYKEQIDMRTENKSLIEKIQKLKQQNMQIKGRVIEGLEKIEGHMHNLPCEREKTALIELEKIKKELDRERKMREDLENKVQNTIQDFSRLYEEADLARKIIIGKLRKLQITEEQLDYGFLTIEELAKFNPQSQGHPHQIHLLHPAHIETPHKHQPQLTNIGASHVKEDRVLQSPHSHNHNNIGSGSRMTESISKHEAREKQSFGDSTIKRESFVKSRNLADKVGMMRGNMETFKKMKF